MISYALLLLSIIIAVIGQVLFKVGVQSQGSVDMVFWKIFLSPSVLFGLSLYFLSALIYIQVLKVIPLSIAYPSLALSYVIVVLAGFYLFNESLQKGQILGLILIVVGVSLLWLKK